MLLHLVVNLDSLSWLLHKHLTSWRSWSHPLIPVCQQRRGYVFHSVTWMALWVSFPLHPSSDLSVPRLTSRTKLLARIDEEMNSWMSWSGECHLAYNLRESRHRNMKDMSSKNLGIFLDFVLTWTLFFANNAKLRKKTLSIRTTLSYSTYDGARAHIFADDEEFGIHARAGW